MGISTERAVGIIRVSRDHDGWSPETQASAMVKLAHDNGWRLSAGDLLNENEIKRGSNKRGNVSGGAQLDDRPGLGPAVAAVERGEVQVIIAERLDRLFRDLDTQRAVVKRVEAAGGRFETIQGRISHKTAESELHANLNGSVAQYVRRTAMERSRQAVERAVEDGILPYPVVPVGYLKRSDGRLEPDRATCDVVAHAFAMRLEGMPIAAIKDYLNQHGVNYSYGGVVKMLQNRIYLGEIHFGRLTNLTAHDGIVDRKVFEAVQRKVISKGRMPKSPRLLARQKVLRCGTCGAAMTVTKTGNRSDYPAYRCPPSNECSCRVTVGATIVENAVIKVVKETLADRQGRASAQANVQAAVDALQSAQEALDTAITAFAAAGLSTEPKAITELTTLREARDAAQVRLDQITPQKADLTVTADDWDSLTLAEQRDLIRALIKRVSIAPGRGEDRITIELL